MHAIKESSAKELKKTTTRITTRDGKVYEERPSSSSEVREQVLIGQGEFSTTPRKISNHYVTVCLTLVKIYIFNNKTRV